MDSYMCTPIYRPSSFLSRKETDPAAVHEMGAASKKKKKAFAIQDLLQKGFGPLIVGNHGCGYIPPKSVSQSVAGGVEVAGLSSRAERINPPNGRGRTRLHFVSRVTRRRRALQSVAPTISQSFSHSVQQSQSIQFRCWVCVAHPLISTRPSAVWLSIVICFVLACLLACCLLHTFRVCIPGVVHKNHSC